MSEKDTIYEGESPEDLQIEVINISSSVQRFVIDNDRIRLNPGQSMRLNRAYAAPRKLHEGRDPLPPVIELLTNKQVLPVTDPRARGALAQRDQKNKQAAASPQK